MSSVGKNASSSADSQQKLNMHNLNSALLADSDGEEATAAAEDANRFFDAEPAATNGAEAPVLSEEEREALNEDLKKTEDEIQTLRQVLAARMKHASDLKRRLGLSPWVEVKEDITEGIRHVKETQAYQKTSDLVHATSDSVRVKFGQLKNSEYYKSFESKMGTAVGTIQTKIAASTSFGSGFGFASPPNGSASATGGATPDGPPITEQPK